MIIERKIERKRVCVCEREGEREKGREEKRRKKREKVS